MVARRVSSDDGDSGAHDPDPTVRVQRAWMGAWVAVPDDHGDRYLLCVLSHVQGARPL